MEPKWWSDLRQMLKSLAAGEREWSEDLEIELRIIIADVKNDARMEAQREADEPLVAQMAGSLGAPLLAKAVEELAVTGDAHVFAKRFGELSEVAVGFAMRLLDETKKQCAEKP